MIPSTVPVSLPAALTEAQRQRVEDAVIDAAASNNGWADIGNPSPLVLEAIRARGLVIVPSSTAHGMPTHRAYTQNAQRALGEEFRRGTGVADLVPAPMAKRAKSIGVAEDDADFEAAILASQSIHF